VVGLVSLGIVGIEKLRSLNGPAVLKERVQSAEIGIVHKRAECRRIQVREDVAHCLGEAPERPRVRRPVDIGIEKHGIRAFATNTDVIAVGRAIRQVTANSPGSASGRIETYG
jgi:hypothetical protein